MENRRIAGTNFEKIHQSYSFPHTDNTSILVPVTFTPTDAAHLSKRFASYL